ncbi:carboxypeptidase [Flavobacteriaceae bacterium S0825]|uniref:S10 family peptidase n=1 Tax=Gaetbulibacter sp. S0825 TaxID=2720084 RepID=UPI0014310A99|nr:carboxypeptidase [Gaetbulibacter sp. S0825]MCK0109660.1 carboxypeptidase [Flavobacteriaceae bacterium S0825]NIX65293.1 carboxypeptidase [Gaetbulibacter sp. S0825]
MKKIITLLCIIGITTSFAQSRTIPVDTLVKTTHNTTIKGVSMSYTAETGTQPVWDAKGDPVATLFYTYYTRNNIKNRASRPLIISFNGGPGSASVWMHVAYTGPRILNIDDEGYPVQPYGFKSNPNSIIDVADIVFVNPVNTGYSRMVPDKEGKMPDRKQFFGINEDIKYLAEWVNTFVSRKNRWESPKYIIGESYGGTRVMGLANQLQGSQWMYLNGVILVSPADYNAYNVDNQPEYSALDLPYKAAAAWYHKMLPPALQSKDLTDMLPEVESYAINTLMPAIAKGGFISDAERNSVAEKMSQYTGLSKKVILQHNLVVPNNFFWKELLRDKTGQTIGRLDSRYLGIDRMQAGMSPDYSAELTSWLHSFTPAINHYIKNELNFDTDIKYNMFGPVHPWNNDNNTTRDDLRKAMATNPYLHVLNQSGYYDGATTYFTAKYTLSQIDPSGKLKNRMSFKGYRSGHMMYLRKEDLIKANEDIREFIKKSSANGKAAKY